MMDVKFRAWNKLDGKYLFWKDMYGLVICKDGKLGVHVAIADQCYLLPEEIVLEEYTGLMDATGKEICEGDILKCSRLDSDEVETLVVKNSPGQFSVYNPSCCKVCKTGDGCAAYLSELVNFPDFWKVEIIGDIHTNKDISIGYESGT